jgi:Cap4, dsDNA endonuclease domain
LADVSVVAVTSSGQSHGAAASALGYLYQSQWPLVELLRRGRDEPDSALTLELHDDVAWEQNGTPTELLQVKHHVNAAGAWGTRTMTCSGPSASGWTLTLRAICPGRR